MTPAEAIALAGGRQKDLLAVFELGGIRVCKQAVSRWVRTQRLPELRELQLRSLKPDWFLKRGVLLMAKMKAPKPRRPPNNLAEGTRRAKKKGQAPKGPPFRPKTYGDPETII